MEAQSCWGVGALCIRFLGVALMLKGKTVEVEEERNRSGKEEKRWGKKEERDIPFGTRQGKEGEMRE